MFRWNFDPFDEFRRIRSEIDRAFEPLGMGTDNTPMLEGGVTGDEGQTRGDRKLARRDRDAGAPSTTDVAPWGGVGTGMVRFMPKIDFHEADNEYLIDVEAPGVRKEDLKIEVQGDNLVLSGETKKEQRYENARGVRTERSFGSFYRALPLPRNVRVDNIKANYENGVLHLELPKSGELPASSTRRIALQ